MKALPPLFKAIIRAIRHPNHRGFKGMNNSEDIFLKIQLIARHIQNFQNNSKKPPISIAFENQTLPFKAEKGFVGKPIIVSKSHEWMNDTIPFFLDPISACFIQGFTIRGTL